jgi:hypothetical protein
VESTELVQLAMKNTGAKGHADLARKMGLGPGGDTRVRRWVNGPKPNKPRYDETLVLLRLAGLLREAPGATEQDAQPGDPLEARLEALEARVKESVRLTKQTVRLLLEARPPAAAAPRGRSPGRTGTDG